MHPFSNTVSGRVSPSSAISRSFEMVIFAAYNLFIRLSSSLHRFILFRLNATAAVPIATRILPLLCLSLRLFSRLLVSLFLIAGGNDLDDDFKAGGEAARGADRDDLNAGGEDEVVDPNAGGDALLYDSIHEDLGALYDDKDIDDEDLDDEDLEGEALDDDLDLT